MHIKREVWLMVKIGENCKLIKKLRTKLRKNKQRVAELNKQIAEIESSIYELEKSKLPIKVFLTIENHHVPTSNYSSSEDTHWVNVYYFPDTNSIHAKRDYSWGKKQLYPNEIDLSKFYSSGCDTLDTKLPYGESFMHGTKYQPIIDSAIVDIKYRIEFFLQKNNDIDDWDLIGKLLIASYYNL